MTNVFLSWAGTRAKATAQILFDWLPRIVPGARPWMSPEIEKDAAWRDEILRKLDEAKFAIVCATEVSIESKWLNYEVGYLQAKKTSVAMLQIGEASDLQDSPLFHIQRTLIDQADFRRLAIRMWQKLQAPTTETQWDTSANSGFDAQFGAFAAALNGVRDTADPLTGRQLIEETLSRTTQIQRLIEGRYVPRRAVLTRGAKDWGDSMMPTMKEMTWLIRDPNNYKPPRMDDTVAGERRDVGPPPWHKSG